MDTTDQFRETVSQRHRYAQEWKARTGGKVVGYLCTYVPEELLYAAGMLPVRLMGGHEPQEVTASHIFSMFCAYSRDVLGQGLLGKYSYLDGIVLSHCCPQIRQTFESWRQHLPLEFNHLLWVPSHTEKDSSHRFFLGQVQEFQEAMTEWAGAPVAEEDLRRAIEVYNTNRALLRQVYELRKGDSPPISGADALEMVLASTVMAKEEHNELLRRFLASPSGGKPVEGVRLLVLGSENDDVDLIRMIESLGAVVVMEDNCVGNRYFWNDVSPDGDLVAGVAARYLSKPPCPLRDVGPRRRGAYALELAREYGAEGVVFLRQKFCDPHAFEIPVIQRLFQEEGLPSLTLELDVTVPEGQYRTRIEAFLEMFI